MKLSLRNGRRNHVSTSCTPGRRLGTASTLCKSDSAKAIRRWTNVPCSCCVSSDRSCFSSVKRMAPLSCRSSRRSGNVHGTDRKLPRGSWRVAYCVQSMLPFGADRISVVSSKRRSSRSSRALSRANTIKESTHGGTRRSERFRRGSRRGVGLISHPISASIGPIPAHGNRGWTTRPKSGLAVSGETRGTAPIALPESMCSSTSLPS